MKEQLPSHESHNSSAVPRLGYQALVDYIRPFCDLHYEPELSRIVLGESMHELLTSMRTDHPSVVDRVERMIPKIEQGIGGSEGALSPDSKNFSNCAIIGYGMIRAAYLAEGRQLPPDTVQRPWFDKPTVQTVDDVFRGMNRHQAHIARDYPDLPRALQTYLDMTHSHAGSPYARDMATFAAYEMYDAFRQMEAAGES